MSQTDREWAERICDVLVRKALAGDIRFPERTGATKAALAAELAEHRKAVLLDAADALMRPGEVAPSGTFEYIRQRLQRLATGGK